MASISRICRNNISMEEVCRVCMCTFYPLNNIFRTHIATGDPLYQVLNYVFGFEITFDDPLPPNICQPCLWKVTDFFVFKKKALLSTSQLNAILGEFRNGVAREEAENSAVINHNETYVEQKHAVEISAAEGKYNPGAESRLPRENVTTQVQDEGVHFATPKKELPFSSDVDIEEWKVPKDLLNVHDCLEITMAKNNERKTEMETLKTEDDGVPMGIVKMEPLEEESNDELIPTQLSTDDETDGYASCRRDVSPGTSDPRLTAQSDCKEVHSYIDDQMPPTSSGITSFNQTRKYLSDIAGPRPWMFSGIIHEDPRTRSDLRAPKKRRKKGLSTKDREVQEHFMVGMNDSEIESDLDSFHNASELVESSEEDADGVNSASAVNRDVTPVSGEILWFADPQVTSDFSFIASSGLKVRPSGNHPIHYFFLMFTEDMYDLILRETNHYGSTQVSLSKNPQRHSQCWWDVTREELDTFLGLIFHMGSVKISRILDYWRVDDLYDQPFFSSNMSLDRFFTILNALSFGRNLEGSNLASLDPLSKIRPLLDLFRNNVEKTYCPAKTLCLDETLVMWRGRLYFRQYINTKKHKYNIKLYLLCEPNGFVLNQNVYLEARDAELGGVGQAQKVVKELAKDYLRAGHAIYMDNFYNSVELTEDLLKSKTLVTNTLTLARQSNPPESVSAKLKSEDIISRYSKDGLYIVKWQDRRGESALSSEPSVKSVNITSSLGRSLGKPKITAEYNKNIGGIDKMDQMLTYNNVEYRTIRWYVRLALHVLQTMLNNSFILYRSHSGRKIKLEEFREEIVRYLMYKGENISIPLKKPKLENVHLPSQMKSRMETEKRSKRKKCKVCASKGMRKDVVFFCLACEDKPGLCLEPCFREFHKY